MNSQSPPNEPDPDAIKMFVGQIPRYMDENDLQKLFAEFGPVYQLNVLRDKSTGHSKGCCFVTFYTRRAALEAQNALHNIKTLAGMQHPIQMKPADSEKRVEDRKLFVGMLSKKSTENDVRMMFVPFGTIEECTVLREQSGQSRGCAFITFASRQCAQNAIRGLHHSRTLEGCRSPLVVKLADSHQEKEMKRLQQMQAQLLNGASMAGLGALSQQYLALLQQTTSGVNLGTSLGNLGNSGLSFNALQMQQLLNAAASVSVPGSMQNTQGETGSGLHNLATLAAIANKFPALGSTMNSPNLAALQHLANNTGSSSGGMGGLHGLNASPGAVSSMATSKAISYEKIGYLGGLNMGGGTSQSSGPLANMSSLHNSLPSMGSSDGIGSMMGGNGMNGLSSAGLSNSGPGIGATDGLGGPPYSDMQQQQQYGGLSGLLNPASFSNALAAQTMSQLQHSAGSQLSGSLMGQFGGSVGGAVSSSAAGKQTEGPEGANLFIYHLPQEFGDHDLMQMFMPYGNVISSKVYIDKQTNLSKCFGFVSYDSPISAQNAIQAMNGFQVGVKRLKVQLKRPKTDGKLY